MAGETSIQLTMPKEGSGDKRSRGPGEALARRRNDGRALAPTGPELLSSRSLKIPYQSLSPEALRGVIEEFVTREGTEYGAVDVSLAQKVAAVRAQLERGDAQIVFDPASESCNIVPRRSVLGD